jgi:flagellar export protein FliJ
MEGGAMAFEFSLEAVLRVRESIEEREESALQSIQREVARTVHQIEELSVAIDGAHRAREKALQQAISGGHLQTLLWEEQGAEQRLKSLQGQLQELERARNQQMKVYQSAHRGREMLTDIRTQQKDAYERERLREEQKRLDDIFMARRHRLS